MYKAIKNKIINVVMLVLFSFLVSGCGIKGKLESERGDYDFPGTYPKENNSVN